MAPPSGGAGSTDSRPSAILPPIPLPSFDGRYSGWTSFHDSFVSLVVKDASLMDVERFHYLQSCLQGEAAMFLQNLPMTKGKFQRAWDAVTKRYQNKRLLVRSQLVALTNLPTVKEESASELKRLYYGTWNVIGALAELGRPVTNATDWLVHMTVGRLDRQSRRQWEASVANSTEPPTLESLKTFLEAQIHIVEALGQHCDCKMGCFGSKDKLSKEDMDFLKSHTRYDEATIKEWYKGFKQDCPNGRLTPEKFVDMYKMFFPSGNAEEFCDHVFRTFDMDKNGYIDFKEFLLAIDVTSSGTPEEKLKWAFRMYDVDGNGVIDIQEMTKIVQAIYDMLGACSSNRPADSAEERAKNIFAKMDENNDGQLTQEEFLKGCLQDEELSKMLAP